MGTGRRPGRHPGFLAPLRHRPAAVARLRAGAMSSPAPRASSDPARHPLIAPREAGAVFATRAGEPVSTERFMHDVHRIAASLPAKGHILNFCSDRYRFATVFCAAVMRGQTTLLPPTTTPNVIAAMRAFAPDVYYVTDDGTKVDLPSVELPQGAAPADTTMPPEIPGIAAGQVVACVFTSGSTGEPQPHFKTWGALAIDMRSEAKRFDVGPGHTILGTVPSQHMFGFESTVLLPLFSGATLTAERLYYPADIDAAIGRAAAPRILFITPFHLRAWMASGDAARVETIVSATAPLSVGLARETEERTRAQLYEIYGCTEAGQVATRRTALSAEWEAFDGLRVSSQGDQAFVAGGHVERPTRLMDIIEPLGDGSRFLLHGRIADMVNIAGKRNSIGYLDHQLTSVPGVVDGAFFMPDEEEADGVTRLMAFVVAPTLTPAQIIAELRTRIDAAFLPRPIVMLDRLPRQLTGKLPREQLTALARAARN
ncbi:MAG TPA: AMP-binding protein [Usitatibacter sp.]|nr:AMP-binding protein [Usitatibacter sp.]